MTIDEAWKEHLRELDQLRQSVQNASYEQKDPLLIYKLESFNLFKEMVETMNRKAIAVLMRGQIYIQEPQDVREAAPERREDYSKYRTQKDDYPGQSAQAAAAAALNSPGSPSRLRLHHVWGVTILVLAVAVRNIKIVTGKDFNILFVLVTMKAVPAKESPFL